MAPAKKYRRNVYIPSRLEDKLARIRLFPCTVMAAPTGYGKTAAMREYCLRAREQPDIRFLWQTVMNNEGAYFWEDFTGVLAGLDIGFLAAVSGAGLSQDISERRRFKDAFLALLARIKDECVFVVDLGGWSFSTAFRWSPPCAGSSLFRP